MTTKFEYVDSFRALFSGLDTAYGTGKGSWVKRPPTREDYLKHLEGKGPGIGIGPLRPDNTVTFAAIDLDEPDFEAARQMQKYIPGTSFIERSRSGNAHVWVFFSAPIEAWVPMGILKMATEAAGKSHVEVFPKNHDFAMVKLGNYINLPYHGDDRPVLVDGDEYALDEFLQEAEQSLNDPAEWIKKARWLQIVKPKPRNEGNFGTQPHLHLCAAHIIDEGIAIGDGNRHETLLHARQVPVELVDGGPRRSAGDAAGGQPPHRAAAAGLRDRAHPRQRRARPLHEHRLRQCACGTVRPSRLSYRKECLIP